MADIVVKAQCREATYESIDTPALGSIFITQHALDRYAERALHGKPKSPWHSVMKIVSNPNLVKVNLPLNVRLHKQKKYGAGSCEVWKHPDGRTEFLIVEEEGNKVLVSIYDRLERQTSEK